MDDIKLHNKLNSIGKTAFVNYFDILSNDQITDTDKINALMKEYDYEGASIRVSFFKQIAKSGNDNIAKALKLIEEAKRIDKITRIKAFEYRIHLK
ncbi:hypothetical protein [Paenibacillus sp. ISL-20]|uniref:hypothetical protein n=1 Tax=Paenibacillus sp. ISL-20 TaxID=2819163 RepID=UPI001BEC8473|nr:hypothetical protein [Paenibacillus sp. ISL-20]MBT2759898.1 hypothetical protein [Paenibacillus sp. ISL-20]